MKENPWKVNEGMRQRTEDRQQWLCYQVNHHGPLELNLADISGEECRDALEG